MYKEVNLQAEFANAKSSYELVENLKEHKRKGVRTIFSYGYKTIPIGTLMQKIVRLSKENYSLEEIHKQICYELS